VGRSLPLILQRVGTPRRGYAVGIRHHPGGDRQHHGGDELTPLEGVDGACRHAGTHTSSRNPPSCNVESVAASRPEISAKDRGGAEPNERVNVSAAPAESHLQSIGTLVSCATAIPTRRSPLSK
jgi:hypothetical protein